MIPTKSSQTHTLVIGLGSNLPSPKGTPISTLVAVRPLLEKTICQWLTDSLKGPTTIEPNFEGIRWRWSPLFETDPIGGPKGQPQYINAVVIVDGPKLELLKPTKQAAIKLLEKFLDLEKQFGRDRTSCAISWGPRSLDIDMLAWGALHLKEENLTLPHPRLIERSFVLIPLAAALDTYDKQPRRIAPQENWQE